MKREYDAAIFDMDGTLLDTMRYWRYTTLEYLLAHQMPVCGEDLLRMHDTSSRRLLFEIARREGTDIGTLEEVVAELDGFMNRHYLYDAKMKPDVPAFLDALRRAGMRMCVATGSRREYARNGLGRLGILDDFAFVTDTHEVGMEKGEPDYFRAVARRLDTVPERCVVFEDALYAMKGAKEAGCRVVAIEDDTARRQKEAIRAIADRYILGYRELLGER